jgi:hypothetical protein
MAAAPENSETEIANGKVPKSSGQQGEPAGEPAPGSPEVVIGSRPVSGAGTAPVSPRERTAIVVKRAAPVVNGRAVANPTRPGEAGTYVSMNAQGEVNGANHDANATATNGDEAANPSDVRAVLNPKWVGGQNNGKSQ